MPNQNILLDLLGKKYCIYSKRKSHFHIDMNIVYRYLSYKVITKSMLLSKATLNNKHLYNTVWTVERVLRAWNTVLSSTVQRALISTVLQAQGY